MNGGGGGYGGGGSDGLALSLQRGREAVVNIR